MSLTQLGAGKLPVAVSCLPELTWPETYAASVSWVPEYVPQGFGSGEPSRAVQLFRSCEPYISLGRGLGGGEDWGPDAFITLNTSYPRACGPVALGGHGVLLAPPASVLGFGSVKTSG